VILGLGLVRVRPEVELVGGVRVVAGDGVGVRVVAGDGVGVLVVLRDDILPSPGHRESLRMGLVGVAKAVWEVLMEWGVCTRWLSSRLAYDGPRGRRVRVGGGSKLEVSVLVVERNFTEFPARSPVTTSGSVMIPVFGLGVMVRRRWKDPTPSAVQT
jgi:hypothetical protein